MTKEEIIINHINELERKKREFIAEIKAIDVIIKFMVEGLERGEKNDGKQKSEVSK